MLIPMQALEALADELRTGQGSEVVPTVPGKDELQRKINCPQCHHPLDAHFYAGPGNAVIDSCENCSLIWLDRGVLMRIAHAPDAPVQSEPSFSEDFDSPSAQNWNGLGNQVAGGMIADAIVDAIVD